VLLFALIVAVFLPFAAFNLGGTTPSTGMGEVVPVPKSQPQSGQATLSIRAFNPVILRGSGFKPDERVRITGTMRKTVTASKRGTFTTRLGANAQCASLTLVAVGSKGSRASLNFSQLLCVEE
jgi:hypothetical protein